MGVGREVLPAEDLIETSFTDSLEFTFETIRLDTVRSYNSEVQLVGNYVDPQFGRIDASTFTQVLSRTQPLIGDDDLLFDSLVLRLEFSGFYGRYDTPPVLRIHEITGDWPDGSLINTETSLAFSDGLLAPPTPVVLGENGTAQLSIRLSDALGRRLLYADPDTLGDRELFSQFFKGLYLTTEPVKQVNREPGAILRLLGSSNNTQLELHYREEDETSTVFRAKIEPFQITGSTPRFHEVTRTEEENTLLAEEGPAVGEDDTLTQFEFVQGVTQIRNYVRIQEPEQLGRVAIHRATLTLQVDRSFLGSNDRYTPPATLLALAANPDQTLAFSEDGNVDVITSTQSGVSYDPGDGTYTVDLTRYLQEILTGARENHGFLIFPNGAANRIDRAVLGGLGHPSLAPQLSITYSTLPQ